MPFRNKDVYKVEAKTPHCFMLYYINCGILKGLIASTYFYLLLCKQCLFLGNKLFVPCIHIIRRQPNICRQIKAGNVAYLRNMKAQMPNSLKVLIFKSEIVITWNICLLVFMSGRENSIFQSILPGCSKAGSILSMRLCCKNNRHVSSCIETI